MKKPEVRLNLSSDFFFFHLSSVANGVRVGGGSSAPAQPGLALPQLLGVC